MSAKEFFTFPDCGCQIEQTNIIDGKPQLRWNPEIENIPLDCSRTWNLIGAGNTKGVFQLESRLGSTTAKKLKPENIEQLAALVAILRPGCLANIIDKKSVTQHYIDRKNGVDEVLYFHPSLENILDDTYGLLLYQESAMQISQQLAGFSLQQADVLRKAIGKKKADVMAKVKKEFLEGVNKQGVVNSDEGSEIFGWIEKSQRYSFNKCLDPKTVVDTPIGPKLLDELKVGDTVLAPIDNDTDTYVEVVDIIDSGVQKLYEVELENGTTIRCTLFHKFLCDDNKIYPLYEILIKDLKMVCRIDAKKIIKTRRIGAKPSVDIEVKSNNHLFYGNGIVTSNSHAVSYAVNSYLSAYVKAHFKKAFFTSYLYFAQKKSKPYEEVNELVNNAKLNNVDVVAPSLQYMNAHFKLFNDNIHFGFADIKGLGAAIIIKLNAQIKIVENLLNKKVASWTWTDFLIFVSPYINSRAVEAVIAAGALDYMKETRNKMLFEIGLYSTLTKKEKSWVEHYFFLHQDKNLLYLVDQMIQSPTGRKGACANKNRKLKIQEIFQLLQHPPYKLNDSPPWIANKEEELLGIALTCSIVDGCSQDYNCTCKEFVQGYSGGGIIVLAVKIDRFHEIRTKKGKNPGQKMAFITVSDNSSQLDSVVIFPKEWIQFKHLLYDDNTVLLVGKRSKGDDSLIISKVLQI